MNEILEFSRCKSVCASLLWAMRFGNGQKCICMGASLLFKLCFILEMDKYVRVRAIVALEMDRYVNVCALPLCVNRSLEMDRYVRVSAHPLCKNCALEMESGQICKFVCATFVFKSRRSKTKQSELLAGFCGRKPAPNSDCFAVLFEAMK